MVTSAEPGIVMTPVMEMSLAFVQRTAFSRSEEPMPMIEVPTTWAVDGDGPDRQNQWRAQATGNRCRPKR